MTEMNKNCFNCKHSLKGEICTLFDELVNENCSCFMWNDRELKE